MGQGRGERRASGNYIKLYPSVYPAPMCLCEAGSGEAVQVQSVG